MKQRDYAWEALVQVTDADPNANRGELNVALKSIKEQAEVEDSYLLADEIHDRAKLYRQVMGDVLLTPTALAKHWKRVYEESRRRSRGGSNRSAVPDEVILDGKRGVAPPEWVWVWSWARSTKRTASSFPQQEGYGNPDDTISLEEYEKLRGAWVADGSPKVKAPVIA